MEVLSMDEMELVRVQKALSFAIKQIQTKDITTRHLVAQEFWHSLNRKGLVDNDKVFKLIELTLIEAV